MPFRHSISGTPLRDAVLPSGKSSLLLICPPFSFTSAPCPPLLLSALLLLHLLSRPLEARLRHSLRSCLVCLSSLSLSQEKIISFIAIPPRVDSSLCARQWNVPFSEHAGMLIRETTINRLRKTTISSDMIISRAHSLSLLPFPFCTFSLSFSLLLS